MLGTCAARVVGKLVGNSNSKASITCLLTLPSKAAFQVDEKQQQQQGQQRRPGNSDGTAATSPQPAPPKFVPSVDLLLGGDSTGGLFVWEPFRAPLGSPDRELPARHVLAGHSGEVYAACLTPGPEDPQHTAPRVFTSGACTDLLLPPTTLNIHNFAVCLPFPYSPPTLPAKQRVSKSGGGC